MNEAPTRVLAKLLRAAGALSVVTMANAAAPVAEPATAAPRTEAEQSAIERARNLLDKRHQWIDGLTVESVKESQWPNSSLGCPRPGVQYLQVITSGYTVTFTGNDGARREVHVAGESAVVCGDTLAKRPRMAEGRLRMPQRNVNAMIAVARADLAKRMGAKPEDITMIEWTPLRLPPRVLRCEVAADPDATAVPGYKIVLRYQDREFTYQSDRNSAVPCPPI